MITELSVKKFLKIKSSRFQKKNKNTNAMITISIAIIIDLKYREYRSRCINNLLRH